VGWQQACGSFYVPEPHRIFGDAGPMGTPQVDGPEVLLVPIAWRHAAGDVVLVRPSVLEIGRGEPRGWGHVLVSFVAHTNRQGLAAQSANDLRSSAHPIPILNSLILICAHHTREWARSRLSRVQSGISAANQRAQARASRRRFRASVSRTCHAVDLRAACAPPRPRAAGLAAIHSRTARRRRGRTSCTTLLVSAPIAIRMPISFVFVA